ncbi:MAG: phosphatidylserine decarboxylase [Oscillospiraceae bacterium]|nr:phosphatidylserine decarboxylase [Oscillospiraceae bacterium]
MDSKYYAPYSGLTTDIVGDPTHAEITWDLIRTVEHDASLKRLLEKAIEQGKRLNPDPMTNPVVSLEAYYIFIDRCYRCMPWEIEPYDDFDGLYDNINQSMGCLYFVCDQPLEELKDKGYFHNSLVYHEPFRSWFIKFLSVSGSYLNTSDSWNEECYRNALANPDFHLDDGTYEDHSNWRTFNEFFARRLSDPSQRPIAHPDDDLVVVSPADAVPQGIWDIDSQSKVVANDPTEIGGLSIKTGMLTKVSVLLGKSKYANSFRNGKLTHTFLDINDYHRYHFPVSGTVREAFVIPQDDAPGGVITWLPDKEIYKEYFSGVFGWQSIETRGVVIVETPSGGHVGIVMVGMCQVSSVNFEDTVVPGAVVKKGDPLGYFLFGGSDIIMIFSEDAGFELTAEPDVHINTGAEYGRMKK